MRELFILSKAPSRTKQPTRRTNPSRTKPNRSTKPQPEPSHSARRSTEPYHGHAKPHRPTQPHRAAKAAADTLTDWGYYVFFNIAFYTGARKSEINVLKWSDIKGGTLHIRRSIAQKPNLYSRHKTARTAHSRFSRIQTASAAG